MKYLAVVVVAVIVGLLAIWATKPKPPMEQGGVRVVLRVAPTINEAIAGGKAEIIGRPREPRP